MSAQAGNSNGPPNSSIMCEVDENEGSGISITRDYLCALSCVDAVLMFFHSIKNQFVPSLSEYISKIVIGYQILKHRDVDLGFSERAAYVIAMPCQ